MVGGNHLRRSYGFPSIFIQVNDLESSVPDSLSCDELYAYYIFGDTQSVSPSASQTYVVDPTL